jgi:PAS domain S-box-containing protein
MGVGAPNLMGTPAATCLLLAGLALLILSRGDNRGTNAMQGLALAVCLIALLGTIGYLYGAQDLYAIAHFTGIALPTALALLMLSLGLLLARPTEGLMAQVTADDPGGASLRRWLPVLLLPIALGWFRLVGERLGLFDAVTGTAMMMIIFIVALAVLAYKGARPVSRWSADLQRQREWLRVTLSSIGDAVIATNTVGNITFLNPVAEGLTGWKERNILGHPVQEVFRIINEQTREQADDIVARVLREGRIISLANHTAIQARNGCEIPIEDSAAPILDAAGEVSGVVIVFHDVREKRRAQEALQKSEERFRAFVTASSDAVYRMSADWSEMYHLRGREFILDTDSTSRSWLNKYIHPDDQPRVMTIINEAIRTKSIFELEHRVWRVDGSLGWSFSRAVPLLDANGEITEWFGAARDITERKRTEEALRDSEAQRKVAEAVEAERQRLFDVLETLPAMVCLLTPDYHVAFANRSFREQFGESHGRHCYEYCFGFTAPCKFCESFRVLTTGQPHHWEVKSPDGSVIDAYDFPFTDADGSPLILEMDIDITERRRAEAALRDVGTYNRTLIEASPDPLVTIGPDGRITDVNAATERVTGRSRQELVGTDFSRYFTEPDKAEDGYQQVFREGTVRNYPLEIRHRDGHSTPVLYNATVYHNAEGKVIGIFADARDITERRQAEQALQQAHEELTARASQLRALAGELTLSEQRERSRLAKILHDHLQQLLVAAKFRVTILSRLGDDVIKQASKEVEELIDESIAASRSLTAELSPPILQEAGLNAGLEWLARRMSEMQGLFVELEPEEDGDLPQDIKMLLFESVRELLFNVVKHAHTRSARVNVRRIDGQLQVVVSDNGVGFDPTAMPAAGEGGRGFGLFSIRERLELMGGTFELESASGQGSRIVLSVPITNRTANEPELQECPVLPEAHLVAASQYSDQGRKIRVMLADDHAIFRQGIVKLLANETDIEVIGEAADGQETVELAAKLLPDIILMDLSMSKLNGVEATRIIHNDWPEIRIIGLSMFEEAERAQAMRDAGAVDYITKSGPSEDLINVIRTNIGASNRVLSTEASN